MLLEHIGELSVPHIKIVLVEPEGEINVGLVARTMKNFGFKDLVIVNPKFPLENAKKYASHGVDVLENAKIVTVLDEALKNSSLVVVTSCKVSSGDDILRTALTLKEFVKKIADYEGVITLVFGRESIGLKREEIEKGDILLTIPASKDYPSLNLSHAVAITLYEIFSKLSEGHVPKLKLPSPSEVKILYKNMREAVKSLSMPEHKKRKILIALKKILGRAMLTTHETHVLTGFFRKMCLRKAEKQ
ncbi:MAG: RNA methyltransferase [Thermoprotei archaeon]|nr:MAG: RNA methyltransferase [Thermoprotei archaeon]